MRKLLIIIILSNLCCTNKLVDHNFRSLAISDNFSSLDLRTGEFKIEALNYKTVVHFTDQEKSKINNAYSKFSIDTMVGKKQIFPANNIIFPDTGIHLDITNSDIKKVAIYLSDQAKGADLARDNKDIYNFKQELFKILNENPDYEKCKEILKRNYKKLPPSF